MIKDVVYFSFLSFAMAGCVTSTTVTSRSVGGEEAVVVARFHVLYNGQDISEKFLLEIKDPTGTLYRAKPDNAGLIFARLPVGSYDLATIAVQMFPNVFVYRFQPNRAVFALSGGGKVYDIGRVSIEWSGPGFKVSQLFGAVGALAGAVTNDGLLAIWATDNLTEAREVARARLDGNPDVTSVPVQISVRGPV